ncbi:MAG: nitrous oxide reductase family maturation protein NosD [Magnetospirillum sp.]|nr:nitrous oxide reductase family maturation protein NosD [Magnetospirillum sp.]
MRSLAVAVLAVVAAAATAAPTAPPPREMAEVQALIDAAASGDDIQPPAGHYRGHLVVDKPVTLDGRGQVTLDAGGAGTVVVIRTDGAKLMNFRIVGTGTDHNNEDAAVQIRGNDNVVRDNLIDDALFGIDLQKAYRNVVRRNHITSKHIDLGMRGDAIRLWYSDDNIVDANVIKDSRDFVLWYAKRNRISNNESTGNRYGLHFMFAADNVIEGNKFYNNSTGLSLMYNQGDIIRNNYIGRSLGSTGTCISFKEASGITVVNNDIQYCAQGLFFDVSPFQPGMVNRIENNRIAFHDIAIAFLSDWTGNEFVGNDIKGNMSEVAVFGGGSARRNLWQGNAWDTYEGFDRDRDGVGDTPLKMYNYAGRVWMEVPDTRFFKGTLVLEVLDFLDRLAPFSEPELLLEDPQPRRSKPEVRS